MRGFCVLKMELIRNLDQAGRIGVDHFAEGCAADVSVPHSCKRLASACSYQELPAAGSMPHSEWLPWMADGAPTITVL